MEAEAAPLLDALQLSRDEPPRIPPPAPCISFSGRVQDLDVHIVCNGELDGTAPASCRAMRYAMQHKGCLYARQAEPVPPCLQHPGLACRVPCLEVSASPSVRLPEPVSLSVMRETSAHH